MGPMQGNRLLQRSEMDSYPDVCNDDTCNLTFIVTVFLKWYMHCYMTVE